MAKDTHKDMTAKERETVREVGTSAVATPSTERDIKNVGMLKGESTKTESPAYKAGVETSEEKRESASKRRPNR